MKNKKHGKRYTDDFRKMVVDLYHSGQKVKDLSGEYGVSEVTIYDWIKRFSPVELEDGSSVTPEDYAKLQKQMHKLQGMCQVILGQLITPIFQALSFCTLLSTALRLLADLHRLGSKKQNLTYVGSTE